MDLSLQTMLFKKNKMFTQKMGRLSLMRARQTNKVERTLVKPADRNCLLRDAAAEKNTTSPGQFSTLTQKNFFVSKLPHTLVATMLKKNIETFVSTGKEDLGQTQTMKSPFWV